MRDILIVKFTSVHCRLLVAAVFHSSIIKRISSPFSLILLLVLLFFFSFLFVLLLNLPLFFLLPLLFLQIPSPILHSKYISSSSPLFDIFPLPPSLLFFFPSFFSLSCLITLIHSLLLFSFPPISFSPFSSFLVLYSSFSSSFISSSPSPFCPVSSTPFLSSLFHPFPPPPPSSFLQVFAHQS